MNMIFLIGFMGVGKTTNGRLLADLLNVDFVETDRMIEEQCALPIPEIFARYGDAYFRDREIAALKKLSVRRKPAVVSCGGGIIVSEWCRNYLAEQPFSFLLTATEKTCYLRTLGSNRPLLQIEDPLAQIKELWNARCEYYFASAKFVVDTNERKPCDICEDIKTKLFNNNWR